MKLLLASDICDFLLNEMSLPSCICSQHVTCTVAPLQRAFSNRDVRRLSVCLFVRPFVTRSCRYATVLITKHSTLHSRHTTDS